MHIKKIAVIGAGISGLMNACMLAEKGHHVHVFEKQPFPPTNPSSMAGGMLAPFSEIEMLPLTFVAAGLKGITLWQDLLQDSHDIISEKCGSLLVAHTHDRYMLERFATHLPSLTTQWEWIDKKRIETLEPHLSADFQHGLYIHEETYINPEKALLYLAHRLAQNGGHIHQKQVTPGSLSPHYDWIIDCRGYVEESDDMLRGVKGEIILVQNQDFHLNRPVRLMHPRYPLYIIPRPDHVFAIGATAIESTHDDQGLVTLRSAMELMSAAYTLSPSFGDAQILDMSSGIRAAYPDNLPRISIQKHKKYIRSNGLFRHGFLLSPVMGKCITDYIETGQLNADFPLFSGQLNSARA